MSASELDSSLSDSDFEVVLVAQSTAALTISDSDSGSLVSAPTDIIDVDSDDEHIIDIDSDEEIIDIDSDDEHIILPNIAQSVHDTPRPSRMVPARFTTPRPPSVAVVRAIVESGHDSDASDREESSVGSSDDSDSDDGSVVHARARKVTITNDRLEAPIASASTATLMTHSNASAATIRPVALARPLARRSTPAGMHAPAITTNSIIGIISSAPLSPPTPSDGGEIPYAPFTAAPRAVFVPVPVSTPTPRPTAAKAPAPPVKKPPPAKKAAPTVAPAIPTGKTSKKMWSAMNVARMKLGFEPLQHVLRKKHNADLKAQKKQKKVQQESEPKPKTPAKPKANTAAKPKTGGNKVNPLVAPCPMVGASPVTSEDEAPRMRASMFSPVNDMSVRSDSPDEAAYDEAIKQLDEHMSSPPEHPTATYRYILNRALLLEFRVCTPETLPTSHGAAIAMVKANVHINVLDYVAKRKEGFNGLRTVMLANAKALRKDVHKRRMPVKVVKSLGLHSLLVLT